MSGEQAGPGPEHHQEDQVVNPELVLKEQADRDERAISERDAFQLREGIDTQYKEKLSSDPFWRQFDSRLAFCDSDRLIEKAIKTFIESGKGRFSEEEVREFAQMHLEHYDQ